MAPESDAGDVTRTVTLREITDENREAVAALRVAPGQEGFVATVAKSYADAAAFPAERPWSRAIYAGDEPVGFLMVSWAAPAAPPREGVVYFLWRLLVDARHQRKGYGRAAVLQVIELVRAEGATEFLTSYEPGDGGPWPFYQRLGFEPTGEVDEGEIVLRLDLTSH
jgi:diamine N-acetyltransferase